MDNKHKKQMEVDVLAAFLTTDVLKVFHNAADDQQLWEQTMRDPQKFLQEMGFTIPEEVRIMLHEAAPLTENTLRTINWDSILQGQPTHIQCPDGLVPVLSYEWREICTKQLDAWVPEIDPYTGEITGHRHVVFCLERRGQVEPRWYCVLPIQ